MPGMHLFFNDPEAFSAAVDSARYPLIHSTKDWYIDFIPHGMASGRTSMMVVIPAKLPTHQRVNLAVETSLQSWMQVAVAIKARYADEVDDPGWAVIPDNVKELLIPRWAEALRRVVPGMTLAQSNEAAAMFIEGLAAGSPEDLHGG